MTDLGQSHGLHVWADGKRRLKESLGEIQLGDWIASPEQRSPDSKIQGQGSAERIRGCRGRAESYGRSGSITNVPRTPWPGTQEVASGKTPSKTSPPEGTLAQMLT